MESKESKRQFYLKWPWDWVVYVLLVILLRIFAIPFIYLIMRWNKKHRPDVPEEGFCVQQTRRQISKLWMSLVFLLVALCGGAVFVAGLLTYERTWEEYAMMAGGAVVGLGSLALAIYVGYTSLRDVFCPEKSTLAQSIRSQMPYPEEAPSAREMFAMVDKDIQENGKWFDKVAVGKEWVLGEQASYIPRIRAVFPRDEIVHRHAGGRVQTSRIVELWIMDDRHQVQSTTLKDYRELQPLVDCIQLRAPDALILPYSEFDRYNFMEDEEWQKVLQDFCLRDGRRKASQPRTESQPAQNMILTRADGTVTSRLSMDVLSQTLEECLQAPEETFFLTPSRPIQGEKGAYMELLCSAGTALEGKVRMLLVEAPAQQGGQPENGLHGMVNPEEAEKVLAAWLGGKMPDTTGWTQVQLRMEQQENPQELRPPKLSLVSRRGVSQNHENFTLEDVQVAADGMVDGSYQQVDLTLPGGWLWMRLVAGNADDGRCTVLVTRADPDTLRMFKIKTTPRKAAAWLMDFARGQFRPDWSQWEDITKEVENQ